MYLFDYRCKATVVRKTHFLCTKLVARLVGSYHICNEAEYNYYWLWFSLLDNISNDGK